MRPCILALTPDDAKPSYSMAGLAYSNEVMGKNMFRCKTIYENGWCLGAECPLYRGFGGETPNSEAHRASLVPTSTLDAENTANVGKYVAKRDQVIDNYKSDAEREYWRGLFMMGKEITKPLEAYL